MTDFAKELEERIIRAFEGLRYETGDVPWYKISDVQQGRIDASNKMLDNCIAIVRKVCEKY